MTQQVWLKPNRRILVLAMLMPGLLVAIGLLLLTRGTAVFQALGGLFALIGAGLVLMLAMHWARPRVALKHDQVRFWLRSGTPFEVPVDVVECFFISQADAATAGGSQKKIISVVARLAESAAEYKQRPVKPSLGRWDDGYIMIHGTWCEPLSLDLVNRLNGKLREAHRASKEAAAVEHPGRELADHE